MMICGSFIAVEASTWTSSGKVTNLPTYGKVKDLNVYNKKQLLLKLLPLKVLKYLQCCQHS